MPFTRKQGSGRPQQTSRREDRHITTTHRLLHLKWCRALGNWTAAEWNQAIFSDESRFNLSIDDNHVRVRRTPQSCLCFTVTHRSHSLCNAACVSTNATAHRSPFSTRQCVASHGKGVTRLSSHCCYPSLACPIPRFVSNRAYLGSFGMTSWASHEFERTRSKVTAYVERNV
ncbi:transposable element Tcb1 transposase [Trichonephila clavipes]|nr:transposable element Tcb1 transposase [Trichonephila clavipes]